MLRAETTPPPLAADLHAARARHRSRGARRSSTTATGQVASDVNTLFVVDDQQLSRIYSNGTPTGASVVTKLNSAANLAGFANAGFPAAVVHVDANATVDVGVRGLERLPVRPDQGERDDQGDRRRARHACARRTRTSSTSCSSAATTRCRSGASTT